MIWLKAAAIFLTVLVLAAPAATAQDAQAPARIRVQVIQNKDVGGSIVRKELAPPAIGTPADLGIEMKPVKVSGGDTLDKILIREGIQPDFASRRIALQLNPQLTQPSRLPANATVVVPSGRAFFDDWDGLRDQGTKLRLRDEAMISYEQVASTVASSKSAVDTLWVTADADLRSELADLKAAGDRVAKLNTDYVPLTYDELAAINFANKVLDPANTEGIPPAKLKLLRIDAAQTQTSYYRLAYARWDGGPVSFDVRVRTCRTPTCGRPWNPDADCNDSRDRCGLKVCYMARGPYLELDVKHETRGEAASVLHPDCRQFTQASSPASQRLNDAPYVVWAISQPDQTRVSCIEVVEVNKNTAKNGIVDKELNAEVDLAAMGTPTCR